MKEKNALTKKLTAHARQSMVRASKMASACGKKTIAPEFLFFAIFLERHSVGATILKNMHLTKEDCESVLFAHCTIATKKSRTNLPLDKKLLHILTAAYASAADFHYPYVGTEHVVYALLEQPTLPIKKMLATAQERMQKTTKKTTSHAHLDDARTFDEQAMTSSPPNALAHIGHLLGIEHPDGETAQHDHDPLSQFTTDLSQVASPHPFIGQRDIRTRISTILGRKNKNNPLIIGEPGVGKTALVEHLAQYCQSPDAPAHLHGKHILSLDLAFLIAGTSFRGEFEQRLKDVITQAQERDDIILFIDEIHTIVGTGNTGGSLDAANILKPALARGALSLIGATTFDEYKKYIEKDAAFARRFQKITLAEPTKEQTIKILRGVAPSYASHHHITIPHTLLPEIVTLTDRYIPEQHLPDKALDILDETAARVASTQKTTPELYALRETEALCKKLRAQKEALLTQHDFAQALLVQEQESQAHASLVKQQERYIKTATKTVQTMTREDLAQTISTMTGTPQETVLARPTETIAHAEKIMRKHIIGQNHVLDTIAQTLLRNSTGLQQGHRPDGSFLFLGPTGVGKTYTATTLAKEIYGSHDALIRIDMSEFMERHHSAKLLGAPAGYVGYGEGGTLTEQIRRAPHSVVLFDEIEKAHPDVFHLLLQILEDGYLTDSAGRRADFSHSIIIMTTNAGSADIGTLGFKVSLHHQQSAIPHAITELLPPEILSRIDHICAFKPLSQKALERIAVIALAQLKKQLKKQHITLTIAPQIKKHLAQLAAAEAHNARAIRANMQQHIESPLAQYLLQHPDTTHCTIARDKTGTIIVMAS